MKMKNRFLYFAISLCAFTAAVAPAAAGDSRADRLFGTAGKPLGPAVQHEAKDLPLRPAARNSTAAKYLKTFEIEPQTFKYTLQLLRKEEDFDVYRLSYPSPADTPWPENNVVPAEYYLPTGAKADAKAPAAVVLDILDGGAILPRMLARAAAIRGVAALYIPMPCYNARRPKNDAHLKYLAEDPSRTANGFIQAVMDVRRAKAILTTRPEVDAGQIGITGISLGGIMAALCAGVDGEFDRVVPILAGGQIASITFSSRETRQIRAMMQAKGMDLKDAERVFAPVEPIHFAERIDAGRCLMINASNDEVIPKATTEALNAAMGGPRLVWLPAGHYSAIGFLPMIQQQAIDFLLGVTDATPDAETDDAPAEE